MAGVGGYYVRMTIPQRKIGSRPAADHLGLAFDSLLEETYEDNRTRIAIAGDVVKLMLHFHTPNHLELLTRVMSVLGAGGCDQNHQIIRNFPAIEELFTQLLHVIWVEDDISWDDHEIVVGKMPLSWVEDDFSWDDHEIVAGKMSMSYYAKHPLRRLATVLGQDLVVSCLANLLPNYFNDNDWKKRYTGVISLGLSMGLIAPSLIPSKETSFLQSRLLTGMDRHEMSVIQNRRQQKEQQPAESHVTRVSERYILQ
nr:importin-5-like [Ipomoea trifida]